MAHRFSQFYCSQSTFLPDIDGFRKFLAVFSSSQQAIKIHECFQTPHTKCKLLLVSKYALKIKRH